MMAKNVSISDNSFINISQINHNIRPLVQDDFLHLRIPREIDNKFIEFSNNVFKNISLGSKIDTFLRLEWK